MNQVSLSLNDKFCQVFGRVLILAPTASSEALTSELHLATMQVIPMLYKSPGRSIEISESGTNYRVTNRGNGIYDVKITK